MNTPPPHPTGWDALSAALEAYRSDQLPAGEVSRLFRAESELFQGLPARYRAVLERLLEPLESSALFSEESCAFSRKDLANGLQQWVQAARDALA